MAELTEETTEVVAEAAEKVAKVSRGLSIRGEIIFLGGVTIGFAGGLTAGYFVAKKRLHLEYQKIAEAEIEVMRDYYEAKKKALEEKPDLEELVDELGYKPGKKPDLPTVLAEDEIEVPATPGAIAAAMRENEAIKTTNVFAESTPDNVWDYAVEMKARTNEAPYVIHMDEFAEGEEDFDHATLTYYESDDVLCDERDTQIEDQDTLVGLGNLLRFGHGSGDDSVVYIRNERLGTEFEIVRSGGSYAEEVHGFIQHSDEPRRRGAPHPHYDDE